MMHKLETDLELALRLADAADLVSLKWFGQGANQREKHDGSIVTAADVEVECTLRRLIEKERPSDHIYGEELSNHGEILQLKGRTWILDPIDQTRHFVRGDPNFATLIALMVDGAISVGVVSARSLGYRWWAGRGIGAWRNGRRVFVSETSKLSDTHLAIAGHREWVDRLDWRSVAQLMNSVAYSTGTAGGFLPAMKVASGQLDAFAEPWGSVWDHAALTVIVEEAGGIATNFEGEPARGGSLLVSNKHLHNHLLSQFRLAADRAR